MLQLEHISKSFPGVKALQDVSLHFNGGEVHALCGENGAGKTTLMNIIVGNIKPDAGKLIWKNKETSVENVEAARKLGISIVYQERSLADSLTVAENIFPVNQPLNRMGLISYPDLYQQARVLLDELQLNDILPKTKIDKLTASQKQMVEIAKALAQKPSLLILDEPTASLSSTETEILFGILRRLQQKGTAIIYISHRMPEIKLLADVVSILKDGIYQGSYPAAGISTETIITKMVGRSLAQVTYESNSLEEVALDVRSLTGKKFHNISFTLHKGEILGIAGLQGSGRTDLALSLYGDLKTTGGHVYKNSKPVFTDHPADAIAYGMAYLPDERKTQGLFMDRSVLDNIIAAQLQKGWYSRQASTAISNVLINKIGIRTPSVKQTMQKLSGGNQQKVVLAKCLNSDPSIFIVNEPTHGMDVGAKSDIYNEMKKLTAAGKSILLISSELPELLLLSDRIAVMYNGNIRGILQKSEASEELITRMASGFDKN